MTTGGWQEALLGSWIVVMALVWFIAATIYHVGRIRAWFKRTLGSKQSTYVDMTILQMQNESAREAQEGSSYRKAQHGISEAKGR